MNEQLTFIELFAGIGNFRLGLEKIGWKCVWSNEIESKACTIYRKHYGGNELVEGDIRDVDPKKIPDHTLLCAGFPCQAFSSAGKRKGLGEDRGTLFTHIARIAAVKKPKFLFLENVEGLLFCDSGKAFATIIRILGGLGYLLEWQVFDGKDFGLPQSRRRTIIIGHLTESGRNPRPIFPIKVEKNPKTIQLLAEITGETPSGLSRQGDRLYDIDGISPTIMHQFIAASVPLIYINNEIRPLTPVEVERLQGNPDNYTEGFRDSVRIGLVGNAIAVPMVSEIGKKLRGLVE